MPDELALVFYASQQQYRESRKTVEGRAYAELHAVAFADTSESAFPVPFRGKLAESTPYYVFDSAVDWQFGTTEVLVARIAKAARRQLLSYLRQLQAATLQDSMSALDGYICMVDEGVFIRWAHFSDRHQAAKFLREPGLSDPLHNSRSRDHWYTIPAEASDPTVERAFPLDAGTTLNLRWSSETAPVLLTPA